MVGAELGGQLVVPAGLGVVLEEPLVLADDHLHHPRQAGAHADVHGVGHTITVPYLQHIHHLIHTSINTMILQLQNMLSYHIRSYHYSQVTSRHFIPVLLFTDFM